MPDCSKLTGAPCSRLARAHSQGIQQFIDYGVVALCFKHIKLGASCAKASPAHQVCQKYEVFLVSTTIANSSLHLCLLGYVNVLMASSAL